MARVTQGDSNFIEWDLPEFTPVRLTLLAAGVEFNSTYKNKDGSPKVQANLQWEASDFGDEETRPWIRDWPNVTVGEMQGGDVAKMRELINAVHGRASNAPIAWIDNGVSDDGKSINEEDALFYSLEGDPKDPNCSADGRVEAGLEVLGVLKKKPGKNADDPVRYRVEHYLPLQQNGNGNGNGNGRRAAQQQTAPQAVPAVAAEEEGETCPDCGLVDAHKKTCPQLTGAKPAAAASSKPSAVAVGARSARARAAADF